LSAGVHLTIALPPRPRSAYRDWIDCSRVFELVDVSMVGL
jgi:hypothetical protein